MREDNFYLLYFRTPDCVDFYCEQLHPEFCELIPKNFIINKEFKNECHRKQVFSNCLEIIHNIINMNDDMKKEINTFYGNEDEALLVKLLETYCYVFCVTHAKYKLINIFTDKRSVVYLGFDPLKVL